MKRPGPTGFALVVAFGLVAAIEMRTLLSMVGIDVASELYFPVAAALLVAATVGLYLLSESEDDGDTGEEPPTGNPSEESRTATGSD